MKNHFRYFIFIFLTGLILFFLQIDILKNIPFSGLPFNMLVVTSICLLPFCGKSLNLFIWIYFGLLLDLWFSSSSFYTLSIFIVNNLINIISEKLPGNKIFIFLSVILGSAMIELLNSAFLGFYLFYEFDPFYNFQRWIIPLTLGNLIFSVIVLFLIEKFYVKTSNIN